MADYRPRLREGVSMQAQPDGTAALVDPLFARGVGLDAPMLAVVTALTENPGQRTVPEVLNQAARLAPALTGSALQSSLRALFLLDLIEGAGAATVARARALAAGAAHEVRVLPESRFACQSSGGCCQGYSFGPLAPSDVERLESLDLAAAFPALGGEYFSEKPGETARPGAPRRRYLRSVDDRCVFLRPDHLCGIHVAFGAEAKPNFCKLYPVQAVATVGGLKLYDHGECASFSVSSQSGPTLAEEAPRLTAMLAPERLELYHPVIGLAPGVHIDHGHFQALQHALCELAANHPGDVGQALRAIGAFTRAFIQKLTACPLAEGEPDRTIAAALAAKPWVATAPASPKALSRIALVAGILQQSIQPKLSELSTLQDRLAFGLYQRFDEAAGLVRTLGQLRAAPARTAVSELEQRVLAVTWDDGIEAALRRSLRYLLFSHRALIDETVLPALLRMAMIHATTLMGGKLAAVRAGRTRMKASDFDQAHVAAMRVLRLPVPMGVLVAYQDDVWSALDAAATLATPVPVRS